MNRGHTFRVLDETSRRVVWRGTRMRTAIEYAARHGATLIAQVRVSRYRWLRLDASNLEALLNPQSSVDMEAIDLPPDN